MYQILLYYKYVKISDPAAFKEEQLKLCQELNLRGRIIVAEEGINGTVEGLLEDTEKYCEVMLADERFKDMHFKKSEGNGVAFPKLSVKVRKEIVSLHLGDQDFDPNETTGKYITAEELHEWIHSGKEFYIIDMRNDYEHKVGYFENSILPELTNFRDLPKVLPKLAKLKDKTIVTVCTGGIRCEKASGFLVKNGFPDVYQLYGGIVSYMEKYPNEDFLGKLYVFDGRVTMGFNIDSNEHVIVGKCDHCGKSTDNYLDCKYKHCKGNRHFLACDECIESGHGKYCGENCMKIDAEIAISVNSDS